MSQLRNPRLAEIADAAIAREKVPADANLGADSPVQIRLIAAANFHVKFLLLIQMIPPGPRDDMTEAFNMMMNAAFGPELLQSPTYEHIYSAARKDTIDALAHYAQRNAG